MHWQGIAAMALVLAGCSADEDNRTSPIDVERMNEAALGPPIPIELEPISFDEAAEADMLGAGCNFMRSDGNGSLVIAKQRYALFKHDGQFVRAVSDKGSESLPLGAFAHYDGMANSVRFSIDLDSERPVTPGVVDYDGAVSIGDEFERTIYKATGVIQCGS